MIGKESKAKRTQKEDKKQIHRTAVHAWFVVIENERMIKQGE